MEIQFLKIECVVREDGRTVARITGRDGKPFDLLPGESTEVKVRTEGSGGGSGSHTAPY